MREKIAVAISGAPFPSKASLRKADAVLDALMEPTEEMVSAVTDEGDCFLSFQQMIQAAREGK